MTRRIMLAGLAPVAFQSMTLADSTAVAINGTVRTSGGSVLHLSVETNDVRYRSDATAPALTTGILLTTANSPYWFHGYNGTSNMRFQRSTGTALVSVMAYKVLGDKAN